MSPPAPADVVVLTPSVLRGWRAEVDDTADKSERGTALVVGGAVGTPGAVLLAGLAALRAGAGKLQLAVPPEIRVALGVAVPESGVFELAAIGERARRAAAVAVGPGFDDVDQAAAALEDVLPVVDETTTVVVDAMALGALANKPELARDLRGRVVVTPNATEAGVLLGSEPGDDLLA